MAEKEDPLVDETISHVGELGLIERLRGICAHALAGDAVVGIGDDAAVLRLDDRRVLLATCDVQVEGVHFRRETITPRQLGRRAMAVNLSDIAAMGGSPRQALVSLVLPPDLPVGDFDEIFHGLAGEAAAFGAAVVGGNLASTGDRLVIDVTLLGYADASRVVTRSGARPGDGVWLTGRTGWSAAGRDLLAVEHRRRDAIIERGREADAVPGISPAEKTALVRAHLEPEPRVREGGRLAGSGVVSAMIDVSDGLAADLGHICAASAVGAEIEEAKLPLDPVLARVAAITGRDRWTYVLHGGEDYELLFTAAAAADDEIGRIGEPLPVNLTRIGTVLPADEGIVLVGAGGARRPLGPGGWDHFAARG